jgi:hypothetical protein
MLNGDHAPVLRGLDQMSLLSDDYLPLVADVIRSASAGRQNEVISACKSDPEVAQNIMTGLQKAFYVVSLFKTACSPPS